MKGNGYQLVIFRAERDRSILLTMDDLSIRTGLHPTLIERFLEYGLIEPAERLGAQMLFDLNCVSRLRKIERLRHELGANLASVAVILDLLDRMNTLLHEVERLRSAAP
jgi:DNA-binding transcriptional MerR regulator